MDPKMCGPLEAYSCLNHANSVFTITFLFLDCPVLVVEVLATELINRKATINDGLVPDKFRRLSAVSTIILYAMSWDKHNETPEKIIAVSIHALSPLSSHCRLE
jgi:hypothetical protein